MQLLNGLYLVSSEGKDFVPQQASSNCGSTSVAQWLVNNKNATRLALASPGRRILGSLTHDLNLDDAGDEGAETKLTLARVLQAVRYKYPNLWVMMALVDMNRQIAGAVATGQPVPLFVLDDVRDPGDSLILRGAGLLGYEVIRDDGGGIQYPSDGMNRGYTDFDNSWVNFNHPFEDSEDKISLIGKDSWECIVSHEKYLDRYSSDLIREPYVLHHLYSGMYHSIIAMDSTLSPENLPYYSPSPEVIEHWDTSIFFLEIVVGYNHLYDVMERLATRYIALMVS